MAAAGGRMSGALDSRVRDGRRRLDGLRSGGPLQARASAAVGRRAALEARTAEHARAGLPGGDGSQRRSAGMTRRTGASTTARPPSGSIVRGDRGRRTFARGLRVADGAALSGCRRRPSCSIAAPRAGICGRACRGCAVPRRGVVWCSVVRRWERSSSRARCAMSLEIRRGGRLAARTTRSAGRRRLLPCLQRPAIAEWRAGRSPRSVTSLADAEGALEAVRTTLVAADAAPAPGTACWWRASSRLTVHRCVLRDRRAGVLREGRALPRVWLC